MNTTSEKKPYPSVKRGILTKPKHEPDTTKFKLICWYNQKPNGEFYTELEKLQNKNRKYHDSIDFILTPGGNVTRHDEALNKLLHHVEKYKERIINAWLVMNNFADGKQFLIGQFFTDSDKNKFIQPIFKNYPKECYKLNGETITVNQVFATELMGEPLREWRLKYSETL